MQIALVGLPWTGKTTLLQTLAAYAGITARTQAGSVNQCIVPVPDARLDRLSELFQPKKTTHATIEYLDVPGLDVKGGGVPGTILTHIKNAAALVEVIGAFGADEPEAPAERVAMWRSRAEALETDMLLGDLTIVENRRERLAKQLGKGDRAQNERELALLGRCEEALSDNVALRAMAFSKDEHAILSSFQLLTQKPLLRVVNTDENALVAAGEWLAADWPEALAPPPLVCSAALEHEVAALPEDERRAFMAELGIDEPVLPRLIAASHRLLGLISFFTAGEKEVRSWPIRSGTLAPGAAGEIHSDLERGFIRAEVVAFDELDRAETFAACRDRGTLRLEGKEYTVADGDVMTIRFSV